MTYSGTHTIQNELINRDALSPGTRAYFRQRQRNRLHNLVLKKFREASRESGLTKAQLARRMGRAPEVVTRLLQSPGNWRLDTLSDMLLAIAGEEIEDMSISPLSRAKRNYEPPQEEIAQRLQAMQANPLGPAKADLSDMNRRLQVAS